MAKVTEPVWMLATGADYEWPGTEGDGRSWLTRASHWYMDKLMDALPHDRNLQLTFQDVNHLIAPATALFAPGIALRVLRHHLTHQADEGVTR